LELSPCAVGKFCSFGFAKGWLVCRAKPNVQNAGGEIYFFCAVGCFNFFLCRLVSRQVGLLVCRDSAKLSAELMSSEKSGQNVKGRWFSCLVDGCSVVF